MKKGTIIKLKDGKYKLFCRDSEYFVFAKIVRHRDGWTSMNFNKTATFSALPSLRKPLLEKVVYD